MRILVVEARGLNIGFLGCYGNDWIATPNLDRLAAEGIVFDRHYHHCPNLQPLALDLPRQLVKIDGIAPFAREALAAWRHGEPGLLWIDGPDLTPPWDLPEDLRDVYFDEEEEGEPWLDPPKGLVPSLTLAEQIELQNTYAAAVTWFDAQLGALLDGLRADDELEQTLVCLTTSGGLPLGEHGMIGPARAWLHEECVHIPLLVRLPRGQHAGLRIDALTQPHDLAPTLASLAALPVADAGAAAGCDLTPLLRGEIDAVRTAACSQLHVGDSVEWSLRTAEWAFLLPVQVSEGDGPREPQLYIKPSDRWETSDVRQQHVELSEELEQALRQAMTRQP